jgi:RNA polymerase sigma factor (TIGR02999 family)
MLTRVGGPLYDSLVQDAPPDSGDELEPLLEAWSTQDPAVRERLIPLVYAELRRLAQHYMRGERHNHTLQPTALVNEMYMRLANIDRMQWRDRAHFIATAATLMRRILVDHARATGRGKRGGGVSVTSFDEQVIGTERAVDVLALDDALRSLAQLDPRQSQVVELRFFGGLSIEETAEALSLSPATVKREWTMAKAWLHDQLRGA